MNLYWVETQDHDEDWFVVAGNPREAENYHEQSEGYDLGHARATFVAPVPRHVEARPGWPSDELLLACGATIQRRETPRLVEINGRRYCEGMLEDEIRQRTDDVFEARGDGRPNRTKRSSKN